ncbi:MAG: hypothetical protein Q8O89_01960 [Nanoarchaeota archaeon]|nr:hypothetical protein [Nanoarchaeota archaeon]
MVKFENKKPLFGKADDSSKSKYSLRTAVYVGLAVAAVSASAYCVIEPLISENNHLRNKSYMMERLVTQDMPLYQKRIRGLEKQVSSLEEKNGKLEHNLQACYVRSEQENLNLKLESQIQKSVGTAFGSDHDLNSVYGLLKEMNCRKVKLDVMAPVIVELSDTAKQCSNNILKDAPYNAMAMANELVIPTRFAEAYVKAHRKM